MFAKLQLFFNEKYLFRFVKINRCNANVNVNVNTKGTLQDR